MSTPKPRSIAQILDQVGNSGLRDLATRGRKAAELERNALACLPADLAAHCRVGGISEGCLKVIAATPAWASRLRFESPQLLRSLQRRGMAGLRSIQVRIAPASQPRPAPLRQVRLNAENARLLEQTARSVTDPRLAQALARLARRGSR